MPRTFKASKDILLALVFASAIILVAIAAARAGSTTTFRDRSGNITGYSHTDVNGNTTFRDRARNVIGTARSR